jgi:protease II
MSLMSENTNHLYTHSFTIRVKDNSREVFRTICETKDHSLYTPGKSDLVYSISGLAEDNCIFKTTGSNEKAENLWLISAFDPEKEIQLVKYNSSSISLIKIILTDIADSACSIEFYYSLTIIKDTESETNKTQKEIDFEIDRFQSFFKTKFEEV